MAPPKTFMIAPQFPGYLYDTAAAPGPLAHWTSGPSYSYEQFARSNPRPEREERAPRKGRKRAKRNGAPEAYDVADNAGPFLPGMFPYGVGGRPAAYGPSGYEAAERRAKPNPGKYADVMKHYGRAGFGIPRNAPNEGSFPLYPIKRARYALAVVASPAFDAHTDTREQVIRAAVKAHPELKAEAQHVLARVGMRLGHRAAANGRARKNGPTLERPTYPFAEKEEQYAKYTDAQLHYALADAREAAKDEDEMAKAGIGLSKYGWYRDDMLTIAQEIYYRRHPEKRPRRLRQNGKRRK